MTILDDLARIHQQDTQDVLGIVSKQTEQLAYDFALPPMDFTPQNIVYAAMGGSALVADLALSWPGCNVPLEIVRDYNLPMYVGSRTLVIVASYSGTSEETLSAMAQAEEKGAHIAVISAGGAMAERARQKGYPLAVMPPLAQSRYATLYNFKALLDILAACGVVDAVAVGQGLATATDHVNEAIAHWLPEMPTKQNTAKQLALELMGKSVVIYAGAMLAPAARKWKISINENAKQVAWWNHLPEMNHNEFTGWTAQPHDKPYAVVELRSALEHERTQKRFVVTERLLSGMRPAPEVVEVSGTTLPEQLLWAFAFGDFVSVYLALLNGQDPAPVSHVTKLKQHMEQ